jgi:hypothetical protein
MSVDLMADDGKHFIVTKGTGMTAMRAKKYVTFMNLFGLEIVEVLAEGVAPSAGGPTGTAIVKVSDLLTGGFVQPTDDLRIMFCVNPLPEDESGRGFYNPGDTIGGGVLDKMFKQLARNGSATSILPDLATQWLNVKKWRDGVTPPTVHQLLWSSDIVRANLDVAISNQIKFAGL